MSSILKVDTLQDVNGNAIISSDGSGNISIPNLTTTGDINFGDNDKANFGASNDLQIYHDGSSSLIKDTGTGNLYIDATNLYLRSATGETYLSAITDGALGLRYNGSEKLATTATGIDVTGTITSTGNITTSGTIESIAPERHSIRPSLNLDFANSKTLDPRITFTRASSGVYYDGYSSVKAEENLFNYSQEFDNAYWDKVRADVTANDTTAPDGTTTAEKLAQASGETIGGAVNQNAFTVVSGLYYTSSIFAKAGTNRNFVGLREAVSGGSNTTWFNLSTGAVATTSSNHTASITDVGNGWYRCSITFLTTTTSGGITYYVYETDNSTTVTDNQGFIYIWGGQLEIRDSLTAYTPTTSSAITKYQPQLQTAQSNAARFDHNPTTGESLGLLIEESRTNLIPSSEDLSTFSTSNLTRIDNLGIAPDGTNTADLWYENTSTGVHQGYKTNISITSGNSYTASMYIKSRGRTQVRVEFDGGGFPSASVDYNLTTVSVTENGSATGSIESIGNDWYRISATATADTTRTAVPFYIKFNNGSSLSYTGDGYSGFFIWGVQFEQGSFPTSYIKTTGSQVTRSADSTSMTGTNFSDWYRQGEGSVYVESKTFGAVTSTYPQIFTFRKSDLSLTGNMAVTYEQSPTSVSYAARDVNHTLMFNNAASTASQPSKVSVSAAPNDFGFALDSTLTTISAGGAKTLSPNINALYVGYSGSGNWLNGYIKKLSYYPIGLTDNEIQDLSEA